MNEQLLAVKRLMENTGAEWWIDSGTLLGLVREGDVLPWDNDIDIGIWLEDSPTVGKILADKAPEEGHYHRLLTMRGDPVMHLLKTQKPNKGLRVTLMVYRLSDDGKEAVCSGYYQKPNPHPEGTTKRRMAELYRRPIHAASRWIRRNKDGRSVLVDVWPFRLIHDEIRFKIPVRYFRDLEPVKGFPAPSPPTDYLAFRYGSDWRVPKPRKSEYVWHRDDKSVQKFTR